MTGYIKQTGFVVMVVMLCMGAGVWGQQAANNRQCKAVKQAQAADGGQSAGVGQYKVSAALDRLLDKIEKSSVKLKSFEADMLFEQVQPLIETMVKRNGKLYYQVEDKTVRARIHFSDFLQQDMDDEQIAKPVKFDEDYVFDGMWVTRRNARTKSIQRWQVSRKPRNREAFRLGKGPFPLPFALKKADMIKEFVIKQMAVDPNDPAGTIHLLLKPRKKSSYAKEYVRLDLWISQKLFVPKQIRFEKGGDSCEINTVSWRNIKTDKKISASVFELKKGGRGWSVEETPLADEKKIE